MTDKFQALLDDADRIAATDLYPARCRRVIADLAAALREQSLDLEDSRKYALALGEELKARAEKTDKLLLLANSMDVDFESYAKAHPAAPDPAAIREAALREAAAVARDHTPEKHSGATLASHVTGRSIESAILALAKGAAE